MKLSITCLVLPVLCLGFNSLASGAGEPTVKKTELRNLGPLPEDRKLDLPQQQERNPFKEVSKQKTVEVANGDSEDARLVAKIKTMPISGMIQDAQGGYKLLFGRSSLKEGDELPKLLRDQTAKLRVSKLTDKLLEISWVETDPKAAPRRIPREINIGSGAYREKLADDIMLYKLSNGQTISPGGGPGSDAVESADLRSEAFTPPATPGNHPPSSATGVASRPR